MITEKAPGYGTIQRYPSGWYQFLNLCSGLWSGSASKTILYLVHRCVLSEPRIDSDCALEV